MSQDAKMITEIEKLLIPITEMNGYEIVRIKLLNVGKRKTLQIMAERPDGTMTIEGCEKLSREYSLILDVNELIHEEYTLEVSSPGIDRPLTRKKDFIQWCGFETLVHLKEKRDNRLKLKGVVKEVIETGSLEDFQFVIEDYAAKMNYTVDFLNVSSARLTLSDELLKATKKGAALHGFAYDAPEAAGKSAREAPAPVAKKNKASKKSVDPAKIEEVEIVS